MYNKKNNLNKKGNLGAIGYFSIVFSFISMLFIFVSIFMYSVSNDYLFFELQNITESLRNDGTLSDEFVALNQGFGDDYTNFNLHLDDLWLIAYLLFVIMSLTVSYKADRQDYFSFLGVLFYGMMFILFLLTIFSTLTEWFKNNILNNMIPTAYILVPKFYYYLDHIGVFSAVHLVGCIVINMLDFDFARIFQRKKQEQVALEDDNEVI